MRSRRCKDCINNYAHLLNNTNLSLDFAKEHIYVEFTKEKYEKMILMVDVFVGF